VLAPPPPLPQEDSENKNSRGTAPAIHRVIIAALRVHAWKIHIAIVPKANAANAPSLHLCRLGGLTIWLADDRAVVATFTVAVSAFNPVEDHAPGSEQLEKRGSPEQLNAMD